MLNSKIWLNILGALREMKGVNWLESLITAVLCTQFFSVCRDLGYKKKTLLSQTSWNVKVIYINKFSGNKNKSEVNNNK